MIDIIPAIDIIDGKCVRLTQGEYSQKKEYDMNPLQMAQQVESSGIRRLHLVDLDGAKHKKLVNLSVLKTISHNTQLLIDWGGGITKREDIERILTSGAEWVVIGSMAVSNPELVQNWMKEFGPEKFILAADVSDEIIMVNAWQVESQVRVFDFIYSWLSCGNPWFLCTDVGKDGMMQGSSVELYWKILQRCPDAKIIASGGVSSIPEILQLNNMGVAGAIIGKAIYEGKITLQELANISL